MQTRPEAAGILAMHPPDLSVSTDKLSRFLCGWLGGPKLFAAKYGAIRLPEAHRHLRIDEGARDAWMDCMQTAVSAQGYAPEFKRYLMEQLGVPAERIRRACAGGGARS